MLLLQLKKSKRSQKADKDEFSYPRVGCNKSDSFPTTLRLLNAFMLRMLKMLFATLTVTKALPESFRLNLSRKRQSLCVKRGQYYPINPVPFFKVVFYLKLSVLLGLPAYILSAGSDAAGNAKVLTKNDQHHFLQQSPTLTLFKCNFIFRIFRKSFS